MNIFSLFIFSISILLHETVSWGGDDNPQFFTLDGRLYSIDQLEAPILDPNITAILQILDYNQTCILYEELQILDTKSSNGYFNMTMGSALTGVSSSKRTNNDSQYSMVQIFSNNTNSILTGKALADGSSCNYIPRSGESRFIRIKMTFSSDGSSREFTPNLEINSVPMAWIAESLQGYTPNNFLMAGTAATTLLTQTNVENIFSATNYPRLSALLNTPINNYITSSGNGAVALPQLTSDPSSGLSKGQIWYNSTSDLLKYYDGSTVLPLGVSVSGVSAVSVGANLTANGVAGGQLTTAGTIDLNSTINNVTIGGNSSLNTSGTIATSSNILANGITAIGNIAASGISANSLSTNNFYSPIVYGGTAGSVNLTLESTTNSTKGKLLLVPSGGNVGIGTTTANAKLEVNGELRLDGTTSGYVGLRAPDTVNTSVTWTLPNSDGLSNQFLTTNGSGRLQWSSSVVTGGSGTVLQIEMGNGLLGAPITTMGTISVNTGTGINQIVQLDGSARLPSVDGSLLTNVSININNSIGTLSVAKGGTGVGSFTPNGLILAGVSDTSPLGSLVCSSGQILIWTIATGWNCQSIVGDAALSNTGSLTLAVSGVTAGTYTKVMVDTKGRVVSGGSLISTDIPSLNWSVINAGKPNTLLGYGITNGVANNGNVPSMQSGLDSSKPTAGTLGNLYITTDSKKIYRDNGTSWDILSNGTLIGTVVNIETGMGLTGGPITSSGTISLADTSVVAASYGSNTVIPTFTVDQQGRLTSAGTAAIPIADTNTIGLLSNSNWNTFNSKLSAVSGSTLTSAKIWVGDSTNQALAQSISGDAALSNTGSLTLAASGVTAGTYTKVMVDTKGRVTVGTSFSQSDITTALTYSPLNRAGDTMTGSLNLPGNGLTVGTNQFIVTGGNIGINTTTPTASKLVIQGSGQGGPGTGSAAGQFLRIGNATALDFGEYSGGTPWIQSNDPNNSAITSPLILNPNGGNIGIGTISPQVSLDVVGAIKIAGDAVGCSASNEGALKYNSTSKGMEFCNGTNWYPVGGGPTSCPTGYTMVGEAGQRGTFCIQTVSNGSTTYTLARKDCHDKVNSDGSNSFLCNHLQWYKACYQVTTIGLGSANEWVGGFFHNGTSWYAEYMGGTNCETYGGVGFSGNIKYRCCVE
jgi:hypothetical protein